MYRSGALSGENSVVADEVRLLESAGHRPSVWTPAFDENGSTRVGAAGRVVWSTRALRMTRRTVRAAEPDVVHVHNLFPNLSPTVLLTARPTVMTLHNFRLACLAATFLRDGRICEDCLGRSPWPGVRHGCYRGSRAQSAAIGASLSLHRALRTFDRVTLFSAVSEFVKEKLVEGGVDARRIRVRHNFSWPNERRLGPGEYFLYLGRLSPEKGLDAIVGHWRSDTRLIVAGDGPGLPRMQAMASRRVEFRGAVEASEVPALLRGARALLVPSTCYEGSPRSIVEAFAAGVPVIASRIGGLPEHVVDGVSGLLATAGEVEEWADAVGRLDDPTTAEDLGEGAYAAWQERFSPDIGLTSLQALYGEAIDRVEALQS